MLGAVADPVNAPANWIVPRLDDVAAGTAVDALTDKTEPVIERPDPNFILVAAGDELFDPNNSELALNGAIVLYQQHLLQVVLRPQTLL